MDFANTVFTLGIIILLVIAIAIAFVIQGYAESRYNLRGKITGKSEKKSTTFLDEGEDEKKCEICYGQIGSDPLAECSCGRVFHDACARPTGSCPYCAAPYGEMEVREPEKRRCPACGRFLSGNSCSCGAVIPGKDNTFVCGCGNIVDADKPVCKRCGAVYEIKSMKIIKMRR
ncbi:MAG: hypothetical protein LBB30_04210 [Candidatus Methanoplasma sp.]|jgi:hypothetical protein|nr:hypothetical protein [Candidatus Methanoplasma sp.]